LVREHNFLTLNRINVGSFPEAHEKGCSLHPAVYAEYQRICAARPCTGDVLEVGAVPTGDSLLCLPALAGARSKIGVNLDGPYRYRDFEIVQANANDLSMVPRFRDNSFDLVLCNAVLEHDRCFWKTVAEIKRVTRPGGLIGIGVPAYTTLPLERRFSKLARMFGRLGVPARFRDPLQASTLTLKLHNYPRDYYRFSPQAVEEVFLEGLVEKELHTLMLPPRVIGFGVKPAQ